MFDPGPSTVVKSPSPRSRRRDVLPLRRRLRGDGERRLARHGSRAGGWQLRLVLDQRLADAPQAAGIVPGQIEVQVVVVVESGTDRRRAGRSLRRVADERPRHRVEARPRPGAASPTRVFSRSGRTTRSGSRAAAARAGPGVRRPAPAAARAAPYGVSPTSARDTGSKLARAPAPRPAPVQAYAPPPPHAPRPSIGAGSGAGCQAGFLRIGESGVPGGGSCDSYLISGLARKPSRAFCARSFSAPATTSPRCWGRDRTSTTTTIPAPAPW
jgi:hypothetical protein